MLGTKAENGTNRNIDKNHLIYINSKQIDRKERKYQLVPRHAMKQMCQENILKKSRKLQSTADQKKLYSYESQMNQ